MSSVQPFAVGLVLFVAIVIVEIILSARWNVFYFTVGLPIFWRRIDRNTGIEDIALEDLQKSTATVAGTPLLFRRLAPDVIAFREKAFGGFMHYTPIMHGVIRRRAEEASVMVLGLVNWSTVAFLLLFVTILGRDFLDMAPFFLGVVAVIYLVQAVRYGRLAKALRAQPG